MENKQVTKCVVLLIAIVMLIGMTACSSKNVYVLDTASFDIPDKTTAWREDLFGEKPSYAEIKTAEKAAQYFEDLWTSMDYDIRQERPYIVSYESGQWYVRGSMEELTPGGVAHAIFSDSGELLAVWGEE